MKGKTPWATDNAMRKGVPWSSISFQPLFGNDKWEPEVSFAKKKFKQNCVESFPQSGLDGMHIAQEEGDEIHCPKVDGFQKADGNVWMSHAAIMEWMEDW